jgi:hypothetical protein
MTYELLISGSIHTFDAHILPQVELKFRDNMTHTDIDVHIDIYIYIDTLEMNYFTFTRDTSFTPNLRIREKRIARDY